MNSSCCRDNNYAFWNGFKADQIHKRPFSSFKCVSNAWTLYLRMLGMMIFIYLISKKYFKMIDINTCTTANAMTMFVRNRVSVIFSSGSTTSDNFKSVGVGGAIECEVEELEKLILDKKERMRAERSRKSFFNFLKKWKSWNAPYIQQNRAACPNYLIIHSW